MRIGLSGLASSAAFILIVTACSRQSKAPVTAKHYLLTGTILSLDSKEHTASVDGEAIPDFMAAMKMDYPIASTAEFAALKVGEHIRATVNMNDDGSYSLSDIHPRAGSEK